MNGCGLLCGSVACQSHCVSVSVGIRMQSDNQNDGSSRRSRRLSNDGNDISFVNITPAAPKKLRFSPRALPDTCCDILGLPHEHHCDACQRWKSTAVKKKARSECASKELQCYKAWNRKEKDCPKGKKAHWFAVTTYLNNKCHIDCAILAQQESERINLAAAISESTTTTTTTEEEALTDNVTPSPPKRNINWVKKTAASQKQSFTIECPASHELHHVSDIRRWQNDSQIVKRIREKMQANQHHTNGMFTQTLWSVALSSTPSLASSAAAFLIPCLVMACLWDTGMFKGMCLEDYTKSFPSDNTLRQHNMNQAARDTVSLGAQISNKKICLACDKGNKKGIGHFVKALSWWDEDHPSVDLRLVDMDASEGSSQACALAIQASINKLKSNDNDRTHLLHGQTTDSGGGGALEHLYEKMQPLGLCVPNNVHLTEHLIANCCLHALQIQLSNALRNAFGDGALDRVNATQMLHAAYRLQESIDADEWRHILAQSSKFVHEYNPSIVLELPRHPTVEEQQAEAAGPGSTNNKKKKKKTRTRAQVQADNKTAFMIAFAELHMFHAEFKKELVNIDNAWIGTVLAKMQAPILTRWWTVGCASECAFDYYLVLFHACQTVINTYESGSKPNDIASDLYSMMRNQETFVDIALIKDFHHHYLNKHFNWFQSCIDLTSATGFQAHNVAVRHYIMACELKSLPMSMKDCSHAVGQWNESTQEGSLPHLDKLSVFMKNAGDALHKHFRRWVSVALLPCGLMSEAPLAIAVSAIMLDSDTPVYEEGNGVVYEVSSHRCVFSSVAHKEGIDLIRFYRFLKDVVVDTDAVCASNAMECAQLVSDDIDLR